MQWNRRCQPIVLCLTISLTFLSALYYSVVLTKGVYESVALEGLRSWPLTSSSSKPTLTRENKFAYAFTISGCTETSCQGYLLNVLVAARILQHRQSKAHVVLLVRMSTQTKATSLLPHHEEHLQKANVKLTYLPQLPEGTTDNFMLAELDKFRVLQLTQYDRVMYLDADSIPTCDLEYMFVDSMNSNGLFRVPVGVAMNAAPATGAFLLVQPQRRAFQAVLEIVQRHLTTTTQFNETLGWGHVITPPDEWESLAWTKKILEKYKTIDALRTDWDFYGASSGQGLLYYWLKYEMLNWTQIVGPKIYHWKQVIQSDYGHITTPIYDIGKNRSITRETIRLHRHVPHCNANPYERGDFFAKNSVYSDTIHFAGGGKPWFKPINVSNFPSSESKIVDFDDFWRYWLQQANQTYKMKLPSFFTLDKRNPLGSAAKEADIYNAKKGLLG